MTHDAFDLASPRDDSVPRQSKAKAPTELGSFIHRLSSFKLKEKYEAIDSAKAYFQCKRQAKETADDRPNAMYPEDLVWDECATALGPEKPSTPWIKSEDALRIIHLLTDLLVQEQLQYFDKRHKVASLNDATSSAYKRLYHLVQDIKDMIQFCLAHSDDKAHLFVSKDGHVVEALASHLMSFFIDYDKDALETPFAFHYCRLLLFLCQTNCARSSLSHSVEKWRRLHRVMLVSSRSGLLRLTLLSDPSEKWTAFTQAREIEPVGPTRAEEAQSVLLSQVLLDTLPPPHYFALAVDMLLFYFEFLSRHENETTLHARILLCVNEIWLKLIYCSPALVVKGLSWMAASHVVKLWHTKNTALWSQVLLFFQIYLDVMTALDCTQSAGKTDSLVDELTECVLRDVKKPKNFSRISPHTHHPLSMYSCLLFANHKHHPKWAQSVSCPGHYVLLVQLASKIAMRRHGTLLADTAQLLFSDHDKNVNKVALVDMLISLSLHSPPAFQRFIDEHFDPLFTHCLYGCSDFTLLSSLLTLLSVAVKDQANANDVLFKAKMDKIQDPLWRFLGSKLRFKMLAPFVFVCLVQLLQAGHTPRSATMRHVGSDCIAFLMQDAEASHAQLKENATMDGDEFAMCFFLHWRALVPKYLWSALAFDEYQQGINDWLIGSIKRQRTPPSASSLSSLAFILLGKLHPGLGDHTEDASHALMCKLSALYEMNNFIARLFQSGARDHPPPGTPSSLWEVNFVGNGSAATAVDVMYALCPKAEGEGVALEKDAETASSSVHWMFFCTMGLKRVSPFYASISVDKIAAVKLCLLDRLKRLVKDCCAAGGPFVAHRSWLRYYLTVAVLDGCDRGPSSHESVLDLWHETDVIEMLVQSLIDIYDETMSTLKVSFYDGLQDDHQMQRQKAMNDMDWIVWFLLSAKRKLDNTHALPSSLRLFLNDVGVYLSQSLLFGPDKSGSLVRAARVLLRGTAGLERLKMAHAWLEGKCPSPDPKAGAKLDPSGWILALDCVEVIMEHGGSDQLMEQSFEKMWTVYRHQKHAFSDEELRVFLRCTQKRLSDTHDSAQTSQRTLELLETFYAHYSDRLGVFMTDVVGHGALLDLLLKLDTKVNTIGHHVAPDTFFPSLLLLAWSEKRPDRTLDYVCSLVQHDRRPSPDVDWRALVMQKRIRDLALGLGIEASQLKTWYAWLFLHCSQKMCGRGNAGPMSFIYFSGYLLDEGSASRSQEMAKQVCADLSHVIVPVLVVAHAKDGTAFWKKLVMDVYGLETEDEMVHILKDCYPVLVALALSHHAHASVCQSLKAILGPLLFGQLLVKNLDSVIVFLFQLLQLPYFGAGDRDSSADCLISAAQFESLLSDNGWDERAIQKPRKSAWTRDALSHDPEHGFPFCLSLKRLFTTCQGPLLQLLQAAMAARSAKIFSFTRLLTSNTRSFNILFALLRHVERVPIATTSQKISALYSLNAFLFFWQSVRADTTTRQDHLVPLLVCHWLSAQILLTMCDERHLCPTSITPLSSIASYQLQLITAYQFYLDQHYVQCTLSSASPLNMAVYLLPRLIDMMLAFGRQGKDDPHMSAFLINVIDAMMEHHRGRALPWMLLVLRVLRHALRKEDPPPPVSWRQIFEHVAHVPLKTRLCEWAMEAQCPLSEDDMAWMKALLKSEARLGRTRVAKRGSLDHWRTFYYGSSAKRRTAMCVLSPPSSLLQTFYEHVLPYLDPTTGSLSACEALVGTIKALADVVPFFEKEKDGESVPEWYKDMLALCGHFGQIGERAKKLPPWRRSDDSTASPPSHNALPPLALSEWSVQCYGMLLRTAKEQHLDGHPGVLFLSYLHPWLVAWARSLVHVFLPVLFYHVILEPMLNTHTEPKGTSVFELMNASLKRDGQDIIRPEANSHATTTTVSQVVVKMIQYGWYQYKTRYFGKAIAAFTSIPCYYVLLSEIDYIRLMEALLAEGDAKTALYFYQVSVREGLSSNSDRHPIQLLGDIYAALKRDDPGAFDTLTLLQYAPSSVGQRHQMLCKKLAHDGAYDKLFSYMLAGSVSGDVNKTAADVWSDARNMNMLHCYDQLGLYSLWGPDQSTTGLHHTIDGPDWQALLAKSAWKNQQWNVESLQTGARCRSTDTLDPATAPFHTALYQLLSTMMMGQDGESADGSSLPICKIEAFIHTYTRHAMHGEGGDDRLVLLNELAAFLATETSHRDSHASYAEWKARKDYHMKPPDGDPEGLLVDFLSLSSILSKWGCTRVAVSPLSPVLHAGHRDIYVDAMLSLIRLFRKSGARQSALNHLYSLKAAIETLGGSHQMGGCSLAVSLEEAKCLWRHEEPKLAIRWLEQALETCGVVQANSGLGHDGPVVQAKGYGCLAKWMALTRCQNPSAILQKCYEKSISCLLSSSSSSARLGKSYYRLAKYSDEQYSAALLCHAESDLETKAALLSHKKAQCKALEHKSSSPSLLTDKERSYYQKCVSLLRHQIALEQAEVDRIVSDASTYLVKAVSNYMLALRHAASHPDDVQTRSHRSKETDTFHVIAASFRLVSLWLCHTEYAYINDLIREGCQGLPTYHFIPLTAQLASRLNDTGPAYRAQPSPSTPPASFQDILERLLRRLAADHPFHTLYQLIALKNGSAKVDLPFLKKKKTSHEEEEASAAHVHSQSRATAASRLLVYIRGLSARHKDITESMERLSNGYMELAARPPPKSTSDRHGLDPHSILACLQDMASIPVITSRVAVDPSGLYDAPDAFVGVGRFESHYTLIGGVNLPKVIRCIGLDGKAYKQLVKSHDDLRTDAVMSQIFSLVDTMLRGMTRHGGDGDGLTLKSYKVVPLQPLSGVLEWVSNTIPVGDWLNQHHERLRPGDKTPSKVRALMRSETERPGSDPASKLALYQQSILPFFKPVFRHFFLETATSPQTWFALRYHYMTSYAVTCMIGYIIGLGDRHPQNILIDTHSGHVLQIDLNMIFDQGKLLRVSERVPFRLTQDMLDPMNMVSLDSVSINGTFTKSCIQMLALLRQKSDLILTLLDTFKFDPLFRPLPVTHHRLAKRRKDVLKLATLAQCQGRSLQQDTDARAADVPDDFDQDSLMEEFVHGDALLQDSQPLRPNHCRVALPPAVLDEQHPLSHHYINPEGERALIRVKEKLNGLEDGAPLSVEGHVNYLLRAATDELSLCQMFVGWQPWM